ncbi:MAG: hypothetical protein AAB267_07810, partial [Candidatus Desantisbacteria bacterium]
NKGTSTQIGWVIIDETAPVIELVSPKFGNPVYRTKDGTVCVTFSYTEANPATATIMIGTDTAHIIGSTTAGTGTSLGGLMLGGTAVNYQGTVTFTNAPDGSYTVWVIIEDMVALYGTSSNGTDSVIVDGSSPKVAVLLPSGTQTWISTATTLSVQFTYSDNNPSTYTVGLGYGTATFPFAIMATGTLTLMEGTETISVSIPTIGIYEGTYTLYVIVLDKTGNYGTATAGTGTLYMDLTKPRQYANPNVGTFSYQVSPGTYTWNNPTTWDDIESPTFNTNWSRGTIDVWGVAADNPSLFSSCPKEVALYCIYAGKTMPTGSPTNYPYASESALISQHGANATKIGTSAVHLFAPNYDYAGTWSVSWNNKTMSAGGYWLITFVYDKAGNVVDGGGGGGLTDVTPPTAITWLEASVQYQDVILKWDSNGVPWDDVGVDHYHYYRHNQVIDWLNPAWLQRDRYTKAEPHYLPANATSTKLNFGPVYEVKGVWGSVTTQGVGTETNYYDGTSYYEYSTSTYEWRVVWTTPIPSEKNVYVEYRNMIGSDTTVCDRWVPENQTFWYCVTAVDAAGNESEIGDLVEVTTEDNTPPLSVKSLIASMTTNSQ